MTEYTKYFPYLMRAHKVGKIVEDKNIAYGDSFNNSADILRILFPDGVKVEQYRDMLGIVRVLDKLSRISHDKDAFGESPWNDIAGYAILGSVNKERQVPRVEGACNCDGDECCKKD